MICRSMYDYSSKFSDLIKSQAKTVWSIGKQRNSGSHRKLMAISHSANNRRQSIQSPVQSVAVTTTVIILLLSPQNAEEAWRKMRTKLP